MMALRIRGICVTGMTPIFGTLLAAGVVAAIPAKADTTRYLNDVENAGISSETGDSGILRTGYQICDLISSGLSPKEVEAQIVYNSDSNEGSNGVDPQEANQLVNFAVADLCPSA